MDFPSHTVCMFWSCCVPNFKFAKTEKKYKKIKFSQQNSDFNINIQLNDFTTMHLKTRLMFLVLCKIRDNLLGFQKCVLTISSQIYCRLGKNYNLIIFIQICLSIMPYFHRQTTIKINIHIEQDWESVLNESVNQPNYQIYQKFPQNPVMTIPMIHLTLNTIKKYLKGRLSIDQGCRHYCVMNFYCLI